VTVTQLTTRATSRLQARRADVTTATGKGTPVKNGIDAALLLELRCESLRKSTGNRVCECESEPRVEKVM
jgi:hypothetical protein